MNILQDWIAGPMHPPPPPPNLVGQVRGGDVGDGDGGGVGEGMGLGLGEVMVRVCCSPVLVRKS